MQISPHRAPLKFKGIAEAGTEAPNLKKALDNGTIDSYTFPFDGKKYRAWEDEKDTVVLAYKQYSDETLVHYPGTTMVHNEEFGIQHHGSGFDTTKDSAVLEKAATTLKATLGKIVAPLLQPKAKAEEKETKTQET